MQGLTQERSPSAAAIQNAIMRQRRILLSLPISSHTRVQGLIRVHFQDAQTALRKQPAWPDTSLCTLESAHIHAVTQDVDMLQRQRRSLMTTCAFILESDPLNAPSAKTASRRCQLSRDTNNGIQARGQLHARTQTAWGFTTNQHAASHYKAWHGPDATRRRKSKEDRIERLLASSGMVFERSKRISLRSQGGTCREIDFLGDFDHGIIYLEIGKCLYAPLF